MKIENIIDTHTHILYGLDEGAQSLDESIEIAKLAYMSGVRKIVATPHKIVGSHEVNSSLVDSRVRELNTILKELNVDVRIFSGAENYAEYEIDEELTINHTNYFLVELPMSGYPFFFNKLIDNLLKKGKIPIIAHPEANSGIRKNPRLLLDLMNKGCICQLSARSILGFAGFRIKRLSECFLYNNVYKLISSNIHSPRSRYLLIEAVKAAGKVVGKEAAIDMVTTNAEKILRGERIMNEPIKRLKTSFLDRIIFR